MGDPINFLSPKVPRSQHYFSIAGRMKKCKLRNFNAMCCRPILDKGVAFERRDQ